MMRRADSLAIKASLEEVELPSTDSAGISPQFALEVERLDSLVDLASEAKELGAYPLADLVFAHCIEHFGADVLGEISVEHGSLSRSLLENEQEDLFAIKSPTAGLLRIPVSRVNPDIQDELIGIDVRSEEKVEPQRRVLQGSSKEHTELLDRMSDILPEVSHTSLLQSADRVLTPEACAEIRKYISDFRA